MGAYENFVQDFPRRIHEICKAFLPAAKLARRDVTLLLTLTSTGIAIPFERLRDPTKCRYPHPSDDRHKFIEAAKQFDTLYRKSFRECDLWDSTFDKWRYGPLKSVNDNPYSWAELWSANPIDSILDAGKVISHLRHSLAHGNIYTLGGENEIEEIILLTGEAKTRFHFLLVTPCTLELFLCKWVAWLQTLPVMPASLVVENDK